MLLITYYVIGYLLLLRRQFFFHLNEKNKKAFMIWITLVVDRVISLILHKCYATLYLAHFSVFKARVFLILALSSIVFIDDELYNMRLKFSWYKDKSFFVPVPRIMNPCISPRVFVSQWSHKLLDLFHSASNISFPAAVELFCQLQRCQTLYLVISFLFWRTFLGGLKSL